MYWYFKVLALKIFVHVHLSTKFAVPVMHLYLKVLIAKVFVLGYLSTCARTKYSMPVLVLESTDNKSACTRYLSTCLFNYKIHLLVLESTDNKITCT